jgi:hypothetical protein
MRVCGGKEDRRERTKQVVFALPVSTVNMGSLVVTLDEIYSRVVRAFVWATAEVATVLVSIPASSDTVESEGRQRNQC